MKFPVSLAAALTLSSASLALAEAPRDTFMLNCQSGEDFTPEICTCLYERAGESFDDAQVARIGTLFQDSPKKAERLLNESSDAGDKRLAERFDEIVELAEICYKDSQ
ncbi:hypothetical protein [Phaeobacter sp. HF9A]|uniref:hypothetical protein n=1 Tax=Phaeobacter sp. HF9A TaxID=2721561 RepID=UPI00142FDB20|nr:hypothetical protein [Phaeobacter sp. HF9A]NIZ14894.1 hypothetical protein [Phaeobacter sp. HF9A]